MEIHTDPQRKLVEIWLTRAEGEDAALRERLQPLYRRYQAQGCTVAVFHSGAQDLADATSHLLCYNRTHMAGRES